LFQQHLQSIRPVGASVWAFSIGGMVRHPLILSYGDLLALPWRVLSCTIACAGHNADQPLIGHAVWRGVPMRALLDELTLEPGANWAAVSAYDGYNTILSLEQLREAALVYEMNGAPLPHEHGFPARLIAPGLAGYKMPKWVTRVEIADQARGGFWESRGLPLSGEVDVTSAILSCAPTAAGDYRIAGVAYAGSHQIARIEISVDDGGWTPIPFQPGESRQWTRWQVDWTPPASGDCVVRVRAADDSGALQAERDVRGVNLRVRS
jgi:hypothetical protein